MREYIIRRLALALLTLFLVTIIVFFSIRLIPGDVVEMMVAEHQHLTQTDIDAIRHKLGLDMPIHVQYLKWVGGIFTRGELGRSVWTGATVTEELKQRWPVSFEIGMIAIVVGLLIAIPVGIYSAIRQDTIGDYISRIVAISFITVPSFWLATMVMVYPVVWWNWTPPLKYIPFVRDPIGNLKQFAIPGVILGMFFSGSIMRMARTMMLEVMRQDYIRTAWAKGLKERVIIMRHALKNALIPIITIVGIQVPVVIGGTVVLEQIFVLPGIGLFILDVINTRDYNMLAGVNLVIAGVVLLINLAVDLTYGLLDPRIQYK